MGTDGENHEETRLISIRCTVLELRLDDVDCSDSIDRVGVDVIDAIHPEVSVFWARDANFGDALNEEILPAYGIPVSHTVAAQAQVIGVGSVLDLVPADFPGVILGTGFMWEDTTVEFPQATVLAVRGRLTAERCSLADGHALLGDPGLLAGRLFDPSRPIAATASQAGLDRQDIAANTAETVESPVADRSVIGIVPHYVDQEEPAVLNLAQRYPAEIRIINVRYPPRQVLAEMVACEHILSSSLHGIIAADALGLPSRWVVLSDRVLGAGFKFRDYFSAFRVDRAASTLRGDESLSHLLQGMHHPDTEIEERVAELDELFRTLPTTGCFTQEA